MIPAPIITEWKKNAPWATDAQVEQDLIISKALVELFNHHDLKDKIAFRGGTALHKIIFPNPLRYSEDIDLNRLEKGPAKPIIDGVREALHEMLGKPQKVKSTKNSVKIIFDYENIDEAPGRLKIEINTRETLPQLPLQKIPYSVNSQYFKGRSEIKAFDKEEMAGTKIRALYQRNKGRDLFDLFKLGELGNIDWDKAVNSFQKLEIGASSKQIADNLQLKIEDEEFLGDINPLIPTGINYDARTAYQWFLREILPRL